MEDNEIIELYWKRNEVAILETDKKYGKYCSKIAYNILANVEDSEECVNDVNGKIICRKMAKKNVVFPTYFLYHEFMI